MATISVSLPSDGTTADAADYNTPITTIVSEINGGLDNANIASGAAIATSKLADDSGITSGKVAAGMPVQIVEAVYSAVATGTTVLPFDDTIPQNNEGDEYMTLAITPKSATNKLSIEAVVHMANTGATQRFTAALFQDSTANALAAGNTTEVTANTMDPVLVRHSMVAGTSSATTFKIRAGANGAGTTTFNGESGARRFGGISLSSIRIIEYKV